MRLKNIIDLFPEKVYIIMTSPIEEVSECVNPISHLLQ